MNNKFIFKFPHDHPVVRIFSDGTIVTNEKEFLEDNYNCRMLINEMRDRILDDHIRLKIVSKLLGLINHE